MGSFDCRPSGRQAKYQGIALEEQVFARKSSADVVAVRGRLVGHRRMARNEKQTSFDRSLVARCVIPNTLRLPPS